MKKWTTNDIGASVLLILYFAELVFPRLNTISPFTYVCLACFLLWLFVAFCSDRSFLGKRYVLCSLLIYAFLAITPIIFGYSVISHRYVSFELVLCGGIIYDYYYLHNKLYQLSRVIIITLVLSAITFIITFSALLTNPYISRSIKSSGEYSSSLASQGIAGYTFVYFIVALCVPVLYLALKRQGLKRIVYVILYVMMVAFVIKSNYMTAFLTVILASMVLIFLLLSLDKGKKGLMMGAVASVAILFIGLNVPNIIGMLASFLPQRISNVLVSGGGSTVWNALSIEFLGDRWPTMQASIDAFCQHPFFGIMGSGDLLYSGNELMGFGQHSFILDTFALYGFIGGILCIVAIISPFKNQRRVQGDRALDISMFVCTLILYVFNNATESIALVVTIIYPLVRNSIFVNSTGEM